MRDSTGNELKPCPFCGGEAFMIEEQDADEPSVNTIKVMCGECSCQTDKHYNEKYAIKEWNRRVNEE